MKTTWLLMLGFAAVSLLGGCSAKMPPVPDPLVIGNQSYDVVFDTVVDVLEGRYEIQVADRTAGIVSTVYRLDRTLLEVFGQDSQTGYQRWEATFHMIRHRIAVGLTPMTDGTVKVVVTAYRQRQAYSAPGQISTQRVDYSIMDPEVGRLDPTALEGKHDRWENQPDNTALAANIYKKISSRLGKVAVDQPQPKK